MPANSGLSPNVVKTALDDVFELSFNPQMLPGYGSVTDGRIFNQLDADSSAEIVEELMGVGYWDETGESQAPQEGQSRTGNQVTYTHTKYTKSLPIPEDFFDDAKHNTIQKMVRKMGMTARTTREDAGMSTFRNAFNSSFVGGDGSALCVTDHTLMNGDTQDNLLTSALSDSSVNDAIVKLHEQKDQDGTIMGMNPAVLLVAPANFKKACQVTDSELESDTADNNINVHRSKYGFVVLQSPFLGDAAGGDDDDWFLLGEEHGLTRYEREGITTRLLTPDVLEQDEYIYKGRFRESTGFSTHIGVVGSNVA